MTYRLDQIPPRIFYTPEGAPILCPPGFTTHLDPGGNATFSSYPILYIGTAPLGEDPLAACDVVVDATTGRMHYDLEIHLEGLTREELREAVAQVAEAASWCITQTEQEQERRAVLHESLAAAGLLPPAGRKPAAEAHQSQRAHPLQDQYPTHLEQPDKDPTA